MTEPVRGRCLIINNEDFSKSQTGDGPERTSWKNRPGSKMDLENLRKVFSKLGFDVPDGFNNLSSKVNTFTYMYMNGEVVM